MQIGDIAHIDDAKAQIGQARQGAVHQLLHHLQAGGKISAQHRAEHGGRIDGHIFHARPIGCHPLARRPFGQRLGLDIGIGFKAAQVGPIRLGQRWARLLVAIGDRGHAAGHHHPLHAGRMGKAQGAQRPFARRDDEVIGVLWFPRRNRGGNMLDALHTGHCFGPTGIAHQIAGHQFQIGQTQRGAHLSHTRQIADRAAHLPAIADQRLDDETRDIARCTGDQHLPLGCSHRHSPACRFHLERDTN